MNRRDFIKGMAGVSLPLGMLTGISSDAYAERFGTPKRWKGEKNRAFRVQRPCSCGCDLRGGSKGVGYITWSDPDGNGVTVWIKDERTFQIVKKIYHQRTER